MEPLAVSDEGEALRDEEPLPPRRGAWEVFLLHSSESCWDAGYLHQEFWVSTSSIFYLGGWPRDPRGPFQLFHCAQRREFQRGEEQRPVSVPGLAELLGVQIR